MQLLCISVELQIYLLKWWSASPLSFFVPVFNHTEKSLTGVIQIRGVEWSLYSGRTLETSLPARLFYLQDSSLYFSLNSEI